jgi:uncharacterized protein (TIGR02246 family)
LKSIWLFLALFLIPSLLGCAQPAPSESRSSAARTVDLAAEEAAVRAADSQWLVAAKARDVEKTVSFWTDDASIMMPGAPPVIGKQAIHDYVAGSLASPDFSIKWTTDKVVVSPSGTMAYSTGVDQVTFKGPGNKLITAKNNGVAIWKKQSDGSWRVAIDIATPETMPSADAAKKN